LERKRREYIADEKEAEEEKFEARDEDARYWTGYNHVPAHFTDKYSRIMRAITSDLPKFMAYWEFDENKRKKFNKSFYETPGPLDKKYVWYDPTQKTESNKTAYTFNQIINKFNDQIDISERKFKKAKKAKDK